MKNKLPCELIQDLFPSYIDGLTSDVTNEIIEEHVEDCHQCKQILTEMKEELAEPVKKIEEKKEIDFLKKTRKKTYKIVLGCILAMFLIASGIYITRVYFVGTPVYADQVEFEVKVQNTNFLGLTGETIDENLAISSVEYTEEDGVVTIHFNGVKASAFSSREIDSHYIAQKKIKRVCIGKRIIWENGKRVTEIASKVYNTRHLYIGDMSANGATARALNMGEVLGSFKNELQTSTEPYGWKMILQNEIPVEEREAKERIMKAYAYILLAVVGNLSDVSYEYIVDGKTCITVVTKEDATKFAERDIKECGENILLLQDLIEDAKMYGRLYVVELE